MQLLTAFRRSIFGLCFLIGLVPLSQAQGVEIPGYSIQPGDIIEISVWKEPDLQRQVVVRPDGGISFPLIGDVQARGLSVDELRVQVTEQIREYIPEATVAVSIIEMSGNRIYVLGRVNSPGEYTALRPITVLQALSMAGGLTPYADEKDIRVLRDEAGTQTSMPFNYKNVKNGKGLEQNITLQPGDVVMVP